MTEAFLNHGAELNSVIRSKLHCLFEEISRGTYNFERERVQFVWNLYRGKAMVQGIVLDENPPVKVDQ